MGNSKYILVVNPGSTSTKLAVFEEERCLISSSLSIEGRSFEGQDDFEKQLEYRLNTVKDFIKNNNYTYSSFKCVVARGGLLRPLEGGVYEVNETMVSDLRSCKYGFHASNFGAVIANEIAGICNIPAYIVDPVVVDEMHPLARLSGIPHIQRKSAFHALNQKFVARKAAKQIGKRYEDANLIVCHMGGGISVGAHFKGRVIDVNNGLEEGPFSPERSGSLPVLQLVDMCFSNQYSKNEIKSLLVGRGGVVSYFGTTDCKKVEEMALQGDMKAQLILEAMAYQISKEIGSCSAVLKGEIDLIVLTGGLARSKHLVEWISERVMFIAPVVVYEGENEAEALVEGVMRVLRGEEESRQY